MERHAQRAGRDECRERNGREGDIFALADSGRIFRFDGTAWTVYGDRTNSGYLRALWGLPDRLMACGSVSTVLCTKLPSSGQGG